MSHNEERAKLKPNRFNKFKTYNSEETKNLSTSGTSRQPHKRINYDIEDNSNKKRMCFGLMKPPTTVNLANNRLQKLKQSLQAELQKEANSNNINMIEKSSKNGLPNVFNESQSPLGIATSNFKNINEWGSPTEENGHINSINHRLKMNRGINTSAYHETARLRDISGNSQMLVNQSFSSHSKNSTITLSPASFTHTPTLTSPEDTGCSPLLRNKINCKRKIEDSPLVVDEYCSPNKLLSDTISEKSPKVRAFTVTKTTSPPLKNAPTRFSSRILKIKRKTDEINSSLNGSPLSSASKIKMLSESDQFSNKARPSCDTTTVFVVSKSDSKNVDANNKGLFDEDFSKARNSYLKKSINVSSQHKLNQFKTISVDKPKIKPAADQLFVKEPLVRNLNFNNMPTTTNLTVKNIKAGVNSVNYLKKTTQHNTKVSFADLNHETLSALNTPLPIVSTDDYDEKMAMTASWIRTHQQFVLQQKAASPDNEAKTMKLVDDGGVDKAPEVKNDVEEMEWTNAEPDVKDISIMTNRNEGTQTYLEETKEKDKMLCIVVDTNVFISEMSKINDVITLKTTGPIQPLIYIPWMVVTELDEMKDRPGCSSLKNKVINAIKCINKLLSEENVRVKGQTVCDMGKQIHVGTSQDDKIIGTCLQAVEKYESVMLLSNDVNLRNKAMINGLAVASSNDIIMKIMSKLENNTKYKKITQKMSLLCSSIICECTKEAYGDVWTKMALLSNPPWSYLECLKRFQKYWVAVFQEKLMKQFLSTIEKLHQLLATNDYISDDSKKYIEFIKLSLNLCIFLKDIEEYRGSIDNTISDITKIG